MPNTDSPIEVIDSETGQIISIRLHDLDDAQHLFLTENGERVPTPFKTDQAIGSSTLYRFKNSHCHTVRNNFDREFRDLNSTLSEDGQHVQNRNAAAKLLCKFALSQLLLPGIASGIAFGEDMLLDFVGSSADGNSFRGNGGKSHRRNETEIDEASNKKKYEALEIEHQRVVIDLKKQIDDLQRTVFEKDNLMEETKAQYVAVAEQQCHILRTEHRREIEFIKAKHDKEMNLLRESISRYEAQSEEIDAMTTQTESLKSQNDQLQISLVAKETEIRKLQGKEKDYFSLVHSLESNAKKCVDEHREQLINLRKIQATKMIELAKRNVSLEQELKSLKKQYEDQCREYALLVSKCAQDSQKEEQQLNLQKLSETLHKSQTELEEAQQNERDILSRYEMTRKTIVMAFEEAKRQVHDRTQNTTLKTSFGDMNAILKDVQQTGALITHSLETAVSLLQWSELHSALGNLNNVFSEYVDCIVGNVQDQSEDHVAIDGVLRYGDRVVFVRTPNSELWRVFTTDEGSQVYMHPDSLQILKDALPSYRDHIAISGRVVMVEEQENNPLSLSLDEHKLAMVTFEDLERNA